MQLHHVSEEGVLAKSDVAYPKLAHSERSELVWPIPQPATAARARLATAEGPIGGVFLRVRTVLSERKSYMYTQWEPTALIAYASCVCGRSDTAVSRE